MTYSYRVQEETVNGYKVKYESTSDTDGTRWIITNVADNDVRLQVKKQWLNSDGKEIKDLCN